ncbi:YraN family protein [Zhihengliuella halotolerans]|uniref:UPF0102 protein EV380_1097 n=1 Tax=Zhihengliuella halotolerans TaxID=370736 RepID=A0A4V2G9S6_9MICC|nr:YraN family protein [Zhihengliuella halotolerans]RZU61526.1 putative endonuclease [Zhihengliuella halotolerans]
MGHNQELGARGEELAARYLEANGYRILERNWRCRGGELDIIATRGGVHIAVEVKTRTSDDYGHAAEAVTDAKRRRLFGLAWQWSRTAGEAVRRLQVDVIAIECADDEFRLDHFEAVSA